MIGNYWSTGIILKYGGKNEWSATVNFYDDGFAVEESTEGDLHTRYFVPIEIALDTIIADAAKLGIVFRKGAWDKPLLMGYGDGMSKDWPMPVNWKQAIEEQAERVGFSVVWDTEKEKVQQ